MIGVFDSGVGGLYIYKKLKQSLPGQSFIYLADQEFAPYGYRSQAEIIERSTKIVSFLQAKGANLVVIACNTATVNAIDELREKFEIPIVGIEPAIKPALAAHGQVIVLATHSTVKNSRYHQLVERFNSGKQVFHIGATELVGQVEAGDLDGIELLKEKLDGQAATAIVIGCTHFSFLKPLIKKMWPQVEIFDGADGVVRRVESLVDVDTVDSHSYDYFFSTKKHAANALEAEFEFKVISL
ncbi:glutamate racemase [Candidatus Berkelbacteria bacterium]|nr:glutamate racemase [Candidatus Berkelbacteria bacterium]